MRHANLYGPAGFVAMEDGEVLSESQLGAQHYGHREAVIEVSERDVEKQDHTATEVLIRAFYEHDREMMKL
ncbi:hypothetical protein [Pandoraea sp. B-6]|uniref:hypothetical protein n=1 Tax=Pandoraea sp. B-6 TaxID=1204340 RepID=UPI00034C0147|nr:hypothetical protein [Pandoraea sp. B-6]